MQNNPFGEPGSGPGVPYPQDKPLGIVMMVLNLCCGVGVGGLVVGGGALLGGLGAAAATQQGEVNGGAVAVGAVGGMVMVLGVVTILLGLVGAAAGFGIMNSQRWGFILGLVGAVLNLITNIMQLVGGNGTSVVGLVVSGAIAYYCWARLNGKMGSPPV